MAALQAARPTSPADSARPARPARRWAALEAASEASQWHAALPTFIAQLLAGLGETWAPLAASQLQLANWIALATPTLGLVLGAALHWLLVDRWGRRRTLLLIPLLSAANALQSDVKVSGVIWGACSGVGLTTSYVYLAEIAGAGLRGRLCCTALCFHSLGRLYVRGLGPGLALHTLHMLALPFALLGGVLVLYAPDTPYNHAAHRRPAHMLLALAAVRGDDQLAPHVREEAVGIHDRVNAELSSHVAGRILSLPPGSGRVATLVLALVGTLPLSGATLTNADPALLCRSWGRAEGLAVVAVVLQLAAELLSAALVDWAGRRPLLCVGTLLMTVSSLFLVAYHWQSGPASIPSWVPMVLQQVHGAAFYLGPGTVAFVYLGELLPLQCVALVPALAACVFAALHALVATLQSVLPLWTLCACSALWSAALLSLVLTLLPETKGMPLHSPRLTAFEREETVV